MAPPLISKADRSTKSWEEECSSRTISCSVPADWEEECRSKTTRTWNFHSHAWPPLPAAV